jgi:hypothetical protein
MAKGRRIIRTAREAVRRGYKVEYIPESEHSPSPIDLLIQKLLNNRGQAFVLMEKTSRKKESAHGMVRRLRRRAEAGGVGDLVHIASKSFWSEGLVRVYGRALTEAEHKALIEKAKADHDRRRNGSVEGSSDEQRDEDGGGEGEG